MGLGGIIGKVLGTAAGAAIGGPTGAAIGGALGGSIGGSIGDEGETPTPTKTGLLRKPEESFKTNYKIDPFKPDLNYGKSDRETIKGATPALKSEDVVSRESYFWASVFDSMLTDAKKTNKET